MLSDVGGGGLASVLNVQSLWPDIMLIIYHWQEIFLLTPTSDSEVILQWYHCIVCGLNRTIERVLNMNMRWLYFFCLFDFVHSHAECGCCSIVCLRFQVMQIKQVDSKMSTKKNFFKENISWYIWTTALTRM